MEKSFDIKAVLIRQPFEYAGINVLGRALADYSALGLADIPYVVAECEGMVSIPEKFDYLAVLYADMPLISADILVDTARYMDKQNLSRVSIGKGYMVNSCGFSHLHADRLLKAVDFLSVNDTNGLKIVYNELRQRIIRRHLASGVVILGDSVTIDDTVKIGAGAVLLGNTAVRGNSYVGRKVRLDNCYVENCIIADDARIEQFSVLINKR